MCTRKSVLRSLVVRGLLALSMALFGFVVPPAFGQSPAGALYQVGAFPPDPPKPTIPPDDDIILYIHGGPGSKLEEASDLVKPLLDAGLLKNKRYTIISFDQLSQGYSSMVDPACFIPQLPTSPGPAAPCPRVHPAVPIQPTPSGPPQITFPITKSQFDPIHNGCLPCVDGTMQTTVTITKNSDGSGHMKATTTTVNTNAFFGFRGGVTVALLDASGHFLPWACPVKTFGVDLALAGASYSQQANVDWSNDIPAIPADTLAKVHYVAIAQKWDPKSLLEDARSWWNAATSGQVWAELGQVAQNVGPTLANGTGPVITPVEAFEYNTLLAFSEESVIALLKQLGQELGPNSHFPEGRNIYIIGGSTGGALTLRMGHRPEAWIKKIVAWNPASVWTTYGTDPDITKPLALYVGFARSEASEDPGSSRADYFTKVFGKQTNSTQPNPEEWYRGNRYPDYQANADTHQPFRTAWSCKWEYIAGARLESEEIYNPVNRRWHWRLGSEMLLFSFFNNDWLGPVKPVNPFGGSSKGPNYLDIRKPTLLVAGDDDDWNEGMDGISTSASTDLDKVLNAGFSGLNDAFSSLTGKSLQGVVSGPKGTGFPRHWENRWTRVHVMAPLMRNTPLSTLYLPNTGHSVHNERPKLFADEIVQFLNGWPLKTSFDPNLCDESDESSSGCKPQGCRNPQVSQPSNVQFPAIAARLLENQDSANYLMQPANPGGNFNDLHKSGPGTYSSRLRPELRVVAQAKIPAFALGAAAASYYARDNVMGDAFADLAVTGRGAYEAFRSRPPADSYIATAAANILPIAESLKAAPQNTAIAAKLDADLARSLAALGPLAAAGASVHNAAPDPNQMKDAVEKAKTRAYKVAWALRNPDRAAAYQLRSQLDWIGVSGEDDAPDRPINVPSGIPIFGPDGKQVSAYPQFDLPITMCSPQSSSPYEPYTWCPQGTANGISFKIRYTIASLSQPTVGGGSSGPVITGVSPSRGPITGGTLVHVSLARGSASNASLTFGGVTPPQARCDSENCWFSTPANAKPGPVDIVVAAQGASPIVPRVSSKSSAFTYTPNAELAGFGHDPSSTDPAQYLVSLDGNAPVGGATIELKSRNPNVVAVPQAVKILGVSAPLRLTISPVPKDEPVTLTATYQGTTIPVNVTAPAWPPISIDLIPPANRNAKFTLEANVTITLPTPAPAGGTTVALTANPANAFSPPLPPSVRVPGGSFYTTFKVTAANTPVNAIGIPVFKSVTLQATPANGTPYSVATRVPFLVLLPRQSPQGGPNGTRQY
jgi:pimeloyl-ACP methyl ester carboxylesterase